MTLMRKTIFVLSILICCCLGFVLGIRSQSNGGYQFKNPIIRTEQEKAATMQAETAESALTNDKSIIEELAESVIHVLLPPAEEASKAMDGVERVPDSTGSRVEATYPNKNIMGHLVVGKYAATVRSDVKEETLTLSPGWVPESAKPVQSGMCIIYGHRNRNHLKLLEGVAVGDPIVFRYLDNDTVTYTVEEIQIFEHTADWTLPDVEGDVLVIATCYPFHYTGNAPGKFQVVCRMLDTR